MGTTEDNGTDGGRGKEADDGGWEHRGKENGVERWGVQRVKWSGRGIKEGSGRVGSVRVGGSRGLVRRYARRPRPSMTGIT